MAPQWNQALVRIASAKDPTTLPTDDNVLFFDDRTITIFDKFAKARYHFLVLPRIPFKASAPAARNGSRPGTPTLTAANGKLNFGSTSSNTVPPSHMNSLSSLMASPYAAEVLDTLRETSERVVQHIRSDMKEQYGVTWDIERAFHAVPSMEHLHLHVVSMDLVSDRLKHKKHFLSFHPTLGFAVRLDAAQDMVRQGKRSLPRSEQAYEQLLRGPLMSHHTGQVFRFFPELKAHLASYWRDNILASGSQASLSSAANAITKQKVTDVDPTSASASSTFKAQHTTATGKTDPSDSAKNDTKGESSDDEDEPTLPMKR